MDSNQKSSRRATLVRAGLWLFAAVIVLVAGAPAQAQTTTITYGTWKLEVKGDAAAVAAGRNNFDEYVLIEYDGITAHEMSRLGFGPIIPTTSAGAGGAINFTVNLKSRNNGETTWVGTMTTTTMTGTLAWTKGGVTYHYTFTGSPYTPVESES